MLEKTGVPTAADLAGVIPPPERLAKGPVAVIECFQRIPCNPCAAACRQGAIREFADINDLPAIDFEKCNGCALCVSRCPGRAIFVVDETYAANEAVVKLPYEFLPVPAKGEEVALLNREGKVVGRGRVERVQGAGSKDRTLVVWVAVPKELSMEVRHIRAGGRQ
mgnify:CR=1 FL=1